MPFDTILATSRVADLRNAGSPLDSEFLDHSLSKATACSPIPPVIRFSADGVGGLPDESVSPEPNPSDLQPAEDLSSRKWLVQDRLGGAMVRHGDRVFGRVSQS